MNRKKFNDLTLKSDYLFGAVLSDKNVAKLFLENLLHVKINEIKVIENQTIFNKSYENKSIRLDVYIESDDEVVYDIEMQQGDIDSIQKRMRFYQGKMDADSLKTGDENKYNTLKKSYIIFICDFDLIGAGQSCYKFENTCTLEDGSIVSLGDKAYKIILYTGGTGGANEEIQSFLRYLRNSSDTYAKSSTSKLVEETYRRVVEVRNDKEMEGMFVNLDEKIQRERAEAAAEAAAEAEKKIIYESIKNFLNMGFEESSILKGLNKATPDDIKYVKETLCKTK